MCAVAAAIVLVLYSVAIINWLLLRLMTATTSSSDGELIVVDWWRPEWRHNISAAAAWRPKEICIQHHLQHHRKCRSRR